MAELLTFMPCVCPQCKMEYMERIDMLHQPKKIGKPARYRVLCDECMLRTASPALREAYLKTRKVRS